MSKSDLKIDWASHKAAKYACEKWHYSKCMPVGKLVKVGAWENEKFIGVVIFSRGANNNMLKPYNLKPDQGCELTRIALTKHKNYVSRILSLAIKFLYKANANLKLIVSYSDLDQSHHGGVYQATNWLYLGISCKDSYGRSWIINGKKIHSKSIHSMGLKNSESVIKNKFPNAIKYKTKGKHRYIYPLQDKDKYLHLAKPYPKRQKQAMDDVQLSQRQCNTDLDAPKKQER